MRQQHQELMLTDIKHVFWSHNPLRPVLSRKQPGSNADVVRRGRRQTLRGQRFGSNPPASLTSDRTPMETASLSITNTRRTDTLSATAFALAITSPSPTASYARIHQRTAVTARPELWLSDGFADTVDRAEAWNSPSLLGSGHHGRLAAVHTRRHAVHVDESDEPVCHVSYFEADAFARWVECARLPTEAEWEIRRTAKVEMSGNFVESAASSIPGPRRTTGRPVRSFARCSATSGSGPPAPTPRIPAIRPLRRRTGRVQRQVHVQPVRAPRRLLCDARRARTSDLPQLLPRRRTLAVLGRPPRHRRERLTGGGLAEARRPARDRTAGEHDSGATRTARTRPTAPVRTPPVAGEEQGGRTQDRGPIRTASPAPTKDPATGPGPRELPPGSW